MFNTSGYFRLYLFFPTDSEPGNSLSHCSSRFKTFPGSFLKYGRNIVGLFLKHSAKLLLFDTKKFIYRLKIFSSSINEFLTSNNFAWLSDYTWTSAFYFFFLQRNSSSIHLPIDKVLQGLIWNYNRHEELQIWKMSSIHLARNLNSIFLNYK